MYNDNVTFYQDTWAYDYNSNTWTNMSPSVSPPPLGDHEGFYDSESDKHIIFGGKPFAYGDYATLNLHQTWVYDYVENTWTNMTTDVHPPKRALGMMAYNSRIDRVCFYGGIGYLDVNPNKWTVFNDTWYYDYNENSWENMNASLVPGPRYSHTLDYDSESNIMILYGGRYPYGE